jgi:Holliday junction resolvasome RuvABC endonuclease subunit
MICIGLDLATKRSGCSIFDNNILLYCTTIDCSEELHIRDRIKYMGEQVLKLVEKYKPNVAFVEDVPIVIFNNKKVSSSLSWLCILQGYIISILDNHNIEYRLYLPNNWRSPLNIITQPKIEAKKDTIRCVNQKFNLKLQYSSNDIKSDDNIADAIGIAMFGIQSLDKQGDD